MVGMVITGVATVVCGDDEDIIVAHIFGERRKPFIEFRKCICVSVDILAVTVEHIEINEIDEAKSVKVLIKCFKGELHTFCIGVCEHLF